MEETKSKAVVFTSTIFPMQEIVIRSSNRQIDKWGNSVNVPGKKVYFNEGLLETNDPEVIEYIQQHPDFKTGKIKLWDGKSEIKKEPLFVPQVRQGSVSTQNIAKVEIKEPAPVDVAPKAQPVQFPKKRGRPVKV